MKIRSGFVSNSSSSSFIIAMDKNKDDRLKITIEIDISKYGEIIENIAALDYYFNQQYCNDWSKKDYNHHLRQNYEKAKKALEDGKKVICGNFNGEDGDETESYLRCHGFPPNVKDCGIEIIDFYPA